MQNKPNVQLTLTETDLNVLAQRFYEASGISLPAMTDKPLIVEGLRGVFTELGFSINETKEKQWVI